LVRNLDVTAQNINLQGGNGSRRELQIGAGGLDSQNFSQNGSGPRELQMGAGGLDSQNFSQNGSGRRELNSQAKLPFQPSWNTL